MTGITRFEDLVAWQRARMLARAVYAVSDIEPFARDRALAWQIQRAAVSVMANIAEGFERGRPAEFHQFVSVAKASCAEVRSHLYLALDNGYIDQRNFDRLMAAAQEVGRLIGGLRVNLERQVLSSRPGRADSSVLSTQYLPMSPTSRRFDRLMAAAQEVGRLIGGSA
jgi:four helix bundle protein